MEPSSRVLAKQFLSRISEDPLFGLPIIGITLIIIDKIFQQKRLNNSTLGVNNKLLWCREISLMSFFYSGIGKGAIIACNINALSNLLKRNPFIFIIKKNF